MVTKPEGDSHSQPSGKSSENDNLEILEYPASPRLLHRTSPVVNPLADSKQLSESLADSTKQLSESPELSSNSGSDLDTLTGRRNRKWPTPWYWQFMVLTVRTFRQSRHVILSKLRISLIIAVAIICSVVWYQVPHVEESITDRYALVSSSLSLRHRLQAFLNVPCPRSHLWALAGAIRVKDIDRLISSFSCQASFNLIVLLAVANGV